MECGHHVSPVKWKMEICKLNKTASKYSIHMCVDPLVVVPKCWNSKDLSKERVYEDFHTLHGICDRMFRLSFFVVVVVNSS